MLDKYKHLPSDENNVETQDGDVIPNPELELYEPDQPEQNETMLQKEGSDFNFKPEKAVSLDLKERAKKVEAISNQISHQAMLAGAKEQVKISNSHFRRQYKNPEAMIESMESKHESLKKLASEALRVLTASDALIEAGFDPDDVRKTEEEVTKSVVFDLRSMTPKTRKKLITKITPK